MVLLALSFQGQVEKYGVYVGIAAFFGLAVLSLLYFAQARELKRLREWAGRAPERARELEERVVAEAEAAAAAARPGAATIAAPQPADAPAAPVAATEVAAGAQETEVAEAAEDAEPVANGNVPAAPAGSAGEVAGTGNGAAPPAKDVEWGDEDASAERPEGEEIEDATAAEGDVPAAVAAGEVADAPADTDAEGPAGAPADTDAEGPAAAPADTDAEGPAAAPAEAVSPAATSAAGAAAVSTAAAAGAAAAPTPGAPAASSGAETAAPPTGDEAAARQGAVAPGTGAVSAPVPRMTPAQRVGVTPRPTPMPLRRSQPSATPTAPAGPRRPPVPPVRRPPTAPRQGRSAGTIALFVGLAVLLLGGGTFLVSQLGGDDSPTPPNRAAPAPGEDPTGSGQSTTPAETNVAVLNGTTFTGLAGQLADRISQQGGYERGATETNTRDQTLQSSTVFFEDGFRAAAREVAGLLSIAAVEPIDEETRALAADADVVVLAGADQAP